MTRLAFVLLTLSLCGCSLSFSWDCPACRKPAYQPAVQDCRPVAPPVHDVRRQPHETNREPLFGDDDIFRRWQR